MFASCYSSGQIVYGRSVPTGALPIARGPAKALRRFVDQLARRSHDGAALLVPGVPEACLQVEGLHALERWTSLLAKHAPAVVTVFRDGHRWPIERKPSQFASRPRNRVPTLL